MTTAVLVDDEANLLDHLVGKLNKVWPELDIAATTQNGHEALSLISDIHPDVVFLDIHMPGLTGLQVASALPDDIEVVFVTAYDQHAVEAFEAAAVDYLLKPLSEVRLQLCVDRLQARQQPTDRASLETLVERLIRAETSDHLQWLRAGQGESVQLVPVEEVVYFKSDQKYTSVFTATDEYLIRTSIKDLASQLDPSAFWRIHRGIIVKASEIENATRDLRGRYTLRLRTRPEKLRTSQSYGHLFRQM
ncbi:MAG: LytTR family DNA-binding domain-containing protein [Pseudomonadales bacterium]|jgi:DNA-binding LytR/AlgR family response regulator|nr:LytTR family DNA-binding domain-containing protein [Pseudomonadales bacterium]MDP6470175.1 LytTR family DNA-binding domain-containing protein [Pseudomonadales bacterium]MDP6827081.1 LytTR family DNA-binding domain-containing protein [Pseudomonadales bacterium]MDP6972761.1 LytTR family DNA-binding domain-containing protein [Pseudomonadales bacterium]|tara:strand:+ start:775 stop:1518 length:744 start_codon:yes stop_codon:yes gene_type:complete